MTRYSSDSDSDGRKRSSKKSKRKSKSRRRSRSRSSSRDTGRSRDAKRRSRSDSRSRSSDRSKRSRSREDRRRRHRSHSEDSYRRSYRRSRSRTRSPRRRRSRSRGSSRDDGYRRHRSRTRSRSTDRSSKKAKKSKKRSRSRDRPYVLAFKDKLPPTPAKPKDPCEDIPGFSDMTPAQQSRLRVQAAFKAAETPKTSSGKASPVIAETALEQMERAQVIDDIEDGSFMPTHFSSSRSNKVKESTPKTSSWPTNFSEQEDYHEMAIFGNSNTLALDERSKKEISEAAEPLVKRTIKWEERDPKTLAHPNLHVTYDEAEKRWIEKLNQMRRDKLKSIGM